jgi:hypothetical protein
VWCRKFNEKTEENRALWGEVKPCFGAKKKVLIAWIPSKLDQEPLEYMKIMLGMEKCKRVGTRKNI